MSAYKLCSVGVIRTADYAFIPPDAHNADWQTYQAWKLAGNVADPADPAPTPPDYGDDTKIDKLARAVVLAAAILAGKTPAQARAALRTAWDSLP